MSDWARDYLERGYAQRWGLPPPSNQTRAEADGLWDQLQLTAGSPTLDLGCGHGRHALALAQRGARVVGVDFADALLTRAMGLAADLDVRAHWLRADIRRVPMCSKSFAGAILIDALGFFESESENEMVLREAARLLVPGGRFGLKVVNGDWGKMFVNHWSDHESRITADCHGSERRGERLIGGARPLQIRLNPRFVVLFHRSPGRARQTAAGVSWKRTLVNAWPLDGFELDPPAALEPSSAQLADEGDRVCVVALAIWGIAGPVVGIAAAMMGRPSVPVWVYGGAFSLLLAAATWAALVFDRSGFTSLGLVPTRARVGEFLVGFAVSVVLFAALALVRGATVEAVWTFAGASAAVSACAGLITAFLLLFPEELLFRGYAFQRLVSALGAWPTIVISAGQFGLYHVAGSGMWGIGAFFAFAMPALGGLLLGWTAVRTNALALPIGLHLGGNWVQASVLSFQSHGDAPSATLWTARLTESQLQTLYAPELVTHLPFIVAMVMAAIAVRSTLRRQPQTA